MGVCGSGAVDRSSRKGKGSNRADKRDTEEAPWEVQELSQNRKQAGAGSE